MNRLAFISFNTGGTLGHSTLLHKLAKSLAYDNEIHILSDYPCQNESFMKFSNINFKTFAPSIHKKSLGGKISHNSSTEFFEYCRKEQINYVLYSTFFDPLLVRGLSEIGIKNIYLSYPLRDTHSELFSLRGYNSLFDDLIVFKDLYVNKYPESVKRSSPIMLPHSKQVNRSSKLLLTCGGGGRPSSARFLQLMIKYIPTIKELLDAEITLIK